MKIVVCIKQVPDTKDVSIDPATGTMRREGVPSIVNPFDLYAVETALKIKDQLGGTVIALTMGPPQAEEALREVIAMGVDDGVLVSDRAFAGSDTLATSYTLSCAIRKLGKFDMIVCGSQAIDGDTAQVGPGVAVLLERPFIAFVGKVEEVGEKTIKVARLMESGHDILEVDLPAAMSVVKEIGEPRLPSLRGKMKARGWKATVWSAQDIDVDPTRIGLSGSPTQVAKVFTPKPRGKGQILQAETADQYAELVAEKLQAFIG
ncbi:MAG: Acryloyl-CoA reductase electron transfer subunit gamma [candidate division BRC1 bacterium ADurb.BinA364]|nr:MAG: Acryloyl-CoA reductase electron transfer subunit gamma [candidate division BRC1 bacterium ADurb.BinA364]